MRTALLTAAMLAMTWVPAMRAQIPTLPTPTGTPDDTVTVEAFRVYPPIPPLGALWRSILLPGWGQSILRRPVTGVAFVVWEGIALTMTLKSLHQLQYLRAVESEEDTESMERVVSKENEVQDWAVLLAFNHLMAAAEAFVAAQLWDFPEELQVQASSNGAFGIRISVSLP